MPMTIPNVPESISRRDYSALMERLGLDPRQLRRLEFGYRSIVAEVFALDADGKRYAHPTDRNELATHTIVIPVVDEDV